MNEESWDDLIEAGLRSLDDGDAATAESAFQAALASAEGPRQLGFAHFYLGQTARHRRYYSDGQQHYRAALEAWGCEGPEGRMAADALASLDEVIAREGSGGPPAALPAPEATRPVLSVPAVSTEDLSGEFRPFWAERWFRKLLLGLGVLTLMGIGACSFWVSAEDAMRAAKQEYLRAAQMSRYKGDQHFARFRQKMARASLMNPGSPDSAYYEVSLQLLQAQYQRRGKRPDLASIHTKEARQQVDRLTGQRPRDPRTLYLQMMTSTLEGNSERALLTLSVLRVRLAELYSPNDLPAKKWNSRLRSLERRLKARKVPVLIYRDMAPPY